MTSTRSTRFDALQAAIRTVDNLPALLASYEATGDHDHGRGPVLMGRPCPGGDCVAARARAVVEAVRLLGGVS